MATGPDCFVPQGYKAERHSRPPWSDAPRITIAQCPRSGSQPGQEHVASGCGGEAEQEAAQGVESGFGEGTVLKEADGLEGESAEGGQSAAQASAEQQHHGRWQA